MVFKNPDGTAIHTTFSYDRPGDRWSRTIDNADEAGKRSPLANLALTRNK